MRRPVGLLLALALPLLAGCGAPDSPAAPAATALASVVPAGGAVGVDPTGIVTVTFNHALMAGMEKYAALHEGDVTRPVVAGSWALSPDRTTLTFTPAAALESLTKYTIHLGGGMMDASGRPVDMDPGRMMGGQYAGGSMMGGGGMMGGGSGMMGPGWQGANGMYGMVFSFTTA